MKRDGSAESIMIKSKPVDSLELKIRVRSAKSLGGKDFNCPSILRSNLVGCQSDEIVILT